VGRLRSGLCLYSGTPKDHVLSLFLETEGLGHARLVMNIADAGWICPRTSGHCLTLS